MSASPQAPLPRSERGIAALLHAVGTLLQALGRDDPHDEPGRIPARMSRGGLSEYEAPRILTTSSPSPEARVEPSMTQPRDPWDGDGELRDEVADVLSNARARAQAIIDESLLRAQQLLVQRPPDNLLERIRRTVADLAMDVRALHTRLDEIESLVRGRAAPRYAPPPTYSSPPAYAPPPAYEAPPTYQSPPPSYQTAFGPPPAVPGYEQAPAEYGRPQPEATPAQSPPVPPSAFPPHYQPAPAGAWPPQFPVEPASGTPAMEQPAADAPPWDVRNGAAFDPADGSVSLRIAPVAGFQGLMRVQDALVRVPCVREAGVEAYAQGEARLRLQLAQRMEPERLANTLGDLLGRPAHVASASIPERTLQVALD
jgi:hypothetical protein